MADKDIILTQAQASGAPKQVAVTPAVGAVVKFDAAKNPVIGVVLGDTGSVVVAQEGDDILAKYVLAKALTPNSAALSATNRATLLISPGTYALSGTLTLDANFVDVVGLGAEVQAPKVLFTGNSISVPNTVTDIKVSGISTGNQSFGVTGNAVAANDGRIFTDCAGGNSSFGASSISSSRFINCVAGTYSFGSTASGSFVNCTAGEVSFGGGGAASGSFIDCRGSGNYCFGGNSTASGNFTNCTSGNYGFGGNGTASGNFTNCAGGSYSFGSTASGTFTNCKAGVLGFGASVLTGKLYYCRLTSGSFQTVSGAGITRLCIDGSNVENNQG